VGGRGDTPEKFLKRERGGKRKKETGKKGFTRGKSKQKCGTYKSKREKAKGPGRDQTLERGVINTEGKKPWEREAERGEGGGSKVGGGKRAE